LQQVVEEVIEFNSEVISYEDDVVISHLTYYCCLISPFFGRSRRHRSTSERSSASEYRLISSSFYRD
jgi:hypothetical protein